MNRVILGTTIACLLIGLGSCSGKVEFNELFSPVYKEFKVEVLELGQHIDVEDHSKRGSWNTKTHRGSYQIRGILQIDSDDIHCGEILKRIDQFVQARTGNYVIEGDTPAEVDSEDKHVYTMWMYNWQRRHGELHVWLFPYPDRKQVGFAIHHYEEDLK